MVNPLILKKFFHHLAPNIERVPASHIFNYEETGSSQYLYDTFAYGYWIVYWIYFNALLIYETNI